MFKLLLLSLIFVFSLIKSIVIDTMSFGNNFEYIDKFNLNTVIESQNMIGAKIEEITKNFELSKKKVVYNSNYKSKISQNLEENVDKMESVDIENIDNVSGVERDSIEILDIEIGLNSDYEEIGYFDEGEYEEVVFEDEFIFE